MREITKLLTKHFFLISQSCKDFKNGVCQKETTCHCKLLSEYAAYSEELIPRKYINATLDDFTGVLPGENNTQVLSDKTVLEAKSKIIQYCWGKDLSPEKDFSSKEMLMNSKITQRRENGNSLIIHGDQIKIGKNSNVEKKQVGKTLLASIVMKEILKQRFLGRLSDTYEWVSFPAIKSKAIEKSEEIIDYQSCDWLVVDNIVTSENVSENMKAFQYEKLNSIFMERIENKLPTILIFEFNINKFPELHKQVGQGISYIANDQDTFKVELNIL